MARRKSGNKRSPTHTARPAPKALDTPARKSARQWWGAVGLLLGVCTVVLVTYYPVLSAQALSIDDNQYFTDNPLVRNPSWNSVKRFLSEVLEPSTVRGYYQPLSMISLMVDYALGGRPDKLAVFHRTSLMLHILNTALVVVLLRLLFRRMWLAALVGLLFGLHPMTVEPVAWVSERKTLLASCGVLLSLLCYVGYTRKRNYWLYGGVLVTFLLALLAKPTATPLPLLLLLLDYWPLRRLNARAVLEKLPLLAMAGVAIAITVISQSRTAQITAPTDYSTTRITLVLCHNMIFYLYKIFWPVAVSGHYAFPSSLTLSHPMFLAGVIGTGILLPALVVFWPRTRVPAVGWLFFFVAIFPTLGLVGFTNVIAADKFAYLPAFGFLMILAAALGWWWERSATINRRGFWRGVTVVVLLLLAALEARGVRTHLEHWRDSVTLYRYMLSLDSKDAVPHYNLGLILARQGDVAAAEEHFAAAVKYAPWRFKAHRELGVLLEKRGDVAGAEACYRQALDLNPKFVAARISLGLLLVGQGQLDEGRAQYELVLEEQPRQPLAHYNLGLVYFQQNQWDEAAQHFQQALDAQPDLVLAWRGLGLTRMRQQRYSDAVTAFQTAQRLEPGSDQIRIELENAERALNRP
ncbi:MAG: tetratricopeptide repeat protein [Planctomycetota bacterium]